MEDYLKEIDSHIVLRAKQCAFSVYMEWEDLAQDLRLRIIENFNSFDKDKSSFRTWASTVMDNYIKNLYKKKDINNETISLDSLKEKGFDI